MKIDNSFISRFPKVNPHEVDSHTLANFGLSLMTATTIITGQAQAIPPSELNLYTGWEPKNFYNNSALCKDRIEGVLERQERKNVMRTRLPVGEVNMEFKTAPKIGSPVADFWSSLFAIAILESEKLLSAFTHNLPSNPRFSNVLFRQIVSKK